jgi:hypothetical protein
VQNCGNCKWLAMDPSCWTSHAKPRLKKDAGGRCEWPAPQVALASSITRAYGFRPIGSSRSYMVATWGADCPVWEKREAVGEKE